MQTTQENDIAAAAVELYDQSEAAILAVTDACTAITINGVEDKENYQKVKIAAMTLQQMRKAIEERRKALKEESLRRGQAIDKMANQLKGLITPTEDRLKKMLGEVDAEIDKNKQREKRAALLPQRREKIAPYADVMPLTDDELLLMDDMQFLTAVSAAAERRNAVIEEENRKLRAQREQEEAERKRKLELEEAQARARQEAEEKAKEAAIEKIGAERIEMLAQAGLLNAEITPVAPGMFGKMTSMEFRAEYEYRKKQEGDRSRGIGES